MSFHEPPRLPRGFRAGSVHCGLKADGQPDLTLLASERPCSAAAVFTRNQVPGAPIVLGRERVADGRLQAVVVNSKVSNVGNGPDGVARARRMGEAAARALVVDPELVLVGSTGVIGVPLPVERIEAALPGLAAGLGDDPVDAARGMMTTDTHPKALSLAVGEGTTLTVLGKGSGMIAPNMATMLVYALTDAALDAPALSRVLRRTVDETFNMLSVDSDTSTSDTCALLANGMAGPVGEEALGAALLEAFTAMTEMLARDGEGAQRLLRIAVTGAASRDDARRVARSLVDSPLVKTMVAGGDPNVGRILMAVGKCVEAVVHPDLIDARISGADVLAGGRRTDFDEEAVRRLLRQDPVDLEVELGLGEGRARAWGCDLTHGYIDENAAYYST